MKSKTVGFDGFLVTKTIQPFALRGTDSNFNDYQRSNLTLYINKKINDLRKNHKEGGQFSSSKLSRLQVTSPSNGKNLKNKNFFQAISLPKQDDDNVQIEKKQKIKAKAVSPQQKVAELLNEELNKKNITPQLYQEYKLANLKSNIMKLQTQKEYEWNQLNHIELSDNEQIQYYMNEICKEHPEIEIAEMLNIQLQKQYVEKNQEDQQQLHELVQKRIQKEEFDKLIDRKSESKYRQNIIRMYKESRYDQFEPELRKANNLKMTTIKKQKETQDKIFNEQILEDKIMQLKATQSDIFHRNPRKYKIKANYHVKSNSQPVTQRQSIHAARPRTAQCSVYSSQQNTLHSEKKKSEIKPFQPELDMKMQELIDKCVNLEQSQAKSRSSISKQITRLSKEIHRSARVASTSYKAVANQVTHHDGFLKFQKESQFKRKLVEFLLNKVPDKNEILSQKAITANTQLFITRCDQQTG